MAERLTELHIVRDFSQALEVAHDIGAIGIGLDLEGVLIPYVGNEPEFRDIHKACEAPTTRELLRDMDEHPTVKYGLMTNNTNIPPEQARMGVASSSAELYYRGIELVHKGMQTSSGPLGAKPLGEQGLLLSEFLDTDPADMVLIDDQWLKNSGEAVKAGFKAIISPPPIGSRNRLGIVQEHPGVMIGRFFEPSLMRSLQVRGPLSRRAFQKIAGIDVNQLSVPILH